MTYNDAYVRGRIPVQPFAGIVRSFIERTDMGEVILPNWGSSPRAHNQKYSAIEAIAGWSCVKRDALEKTLSGRNQTVAFDFADKVLCATVGPDAWQSDPELNEQYNRVSLAGPA